MLLSISCRFVGLTLPPLLARAASNVEFCRASRRSLDASVNRPARSRASVWACWSRRPSASAVVCSPKRGTVIVLATSARPMSAALRRATGRPGPRRTRPATDRRARVVIRVETRRASARTPLLATFLPPEQARPDSSEVPWAGAVTLSSWPDPPMRDYVVKRTGNVKGGSTVLLRMSSRTIDLIHGRRGKGSVRASGAQPRVEGVDVADHQPDLADPVGVDVVQTNRVPGERLTAAGADVGRQVDDMRLRRDDVVARHLERRVEEAPERPEEPQHGLAAAIRAGDRPAAGEVVDDVVGQQIRDRRDVAGLEGAEQRPDDPFLVIREIEARVAPEPEAGTLSGHRLLAHRRPRRSSADAIGLRSDEAVVRVGQGIPVDLPRAAD